MAAEAEAAREARAKVVAAEGEQKASLHLKEAALVLEESTSALQLRYLQVIVVQLTLIPGDIVSCCFIGSLVIWTNGYRDYPSSIHIFSTFHSYLA